jgi:hypothetical protein
MPRPALTNRLRNPEQENPMNINHYIGLDVHKKSIGYRAEDRRPGARQSAAGLP